MLMLLAGCSQADGSEPAAPEQATEATKAGGKTTGEDASEKNAQQTAAEPPPVPDPRAPETEAEKQLSQAIRELGEGFAGEVGIAIRDLEFGWTAHFNGKDFLPQQSVSKLWVALTVLEQSDRGELDLSQEVTLTKEDLTVFYQPIRTLILRNDGYTTTLGELLERAIKRSDNTANDFLLRRVGGPDAVRDVLARKGLGGIRFGPGEEELQSEIAGLEWKPEFSTGPSFDKARADLPREQRRAAFEDYLDDPIDGAMAVGIAHALAKLAEGKLLSVSSTERLLQLMARSATGERRLTAAVPRAWSIAHKTGTGQIFEGTQAGYNDVGIVTSPDGEKYAVAVLIGETSSPRPERRGLMHDVVEALIAYHADTNS